MQVSLRKLLAKQELITLLQSLGQPMGAVAIEDSKGQCLLCWDPGTQSRESLTDSSADPSSYIPAVCWERHPIVVEEVTIGYVRGTSSATSLVSLLVFLVRQEAEKRRLANELLEKYQEIDLFYDISTKLTASLDFQEIAQLVLREVYDLVSATSAVILLRQGNADYMQLLAHVGNELGLPPMVPLAEGLIGTIVQAKKEEIVNQVASDPRPFEGCSTIQNLICVPLITKDHVMGAIVVATTTSTPYTAEDLKQLSIFASQTAVALEKALLHQQTRTAAAEAQAQAQQLHAALIDLQHAQAQLIQSEKMSSLGQLVAGVAHEINNPVNFIYGNLTHASEYAQDLLNLLMHYQRVLPHAPVEIQEEIEAIDLEFLMEDLPRLLTSMRVGADRILEIVRSLRNFSRLDEAEVKAVDIHEGIDSTLMILHNRTKPHGGHPGIQIVKHYGELPEVECYPGQLNQVFMNVLVNAIDALEEAFLTRQDSLSATSQPPALPTITIRTEVAMHSDTTPLPQASGLNLPDANSLDAQPPAQVTEKSTSSVIIRIADNGPGMTDEVKQRLFDPFFTTKEIGKGTGLGMAISHQIIVERHGGILKCRSQLGKGAEFWIQIPVKAVSSTNKPLADYRSPSAPLPHTATINTSMVGLMSKTDPEGYMTAQPTGLRSQELLSRHVDLIKRLTHQDVAPGLTSSNLYHLFRSHPILLKLYTTLLS